MRGGEEGDAGPGDRRDPGVRVRPATAADADAFLELVDALADYEELPRPTAEARARLVQDGFGAGRRFQPHLAELDGEIVAYAITLQTYSSFLARPTLYLEDIFVVPGARGRGVGGAMMRFFAREALRLGCGRMEWSVLDWNAPAIRFYRGLGARRLEEWETYRLDERGLQDLVDRE